MAILGTDTYSLPSQHGRSVKVTVVLFVGPTKDVSCYRGVGSPEWVCDHGDRLGFDDASKHFPSLYSACRDNDWTFGGRHFYSDSEDDPDKIGA